MDLGLALRVSDRPRELSPDHDSYPVLTRRRYASRRWGRRQDPDVARGLNRITGLMSNRMSNRDSKEVAHASKDEGRGMGRTLACSAIPFSMAMATAAVMVSVVASSCKEPLCGGSHECGPANSDRYDREGSPEGRSDLRGGNWYYRADSVNAQIIPKVSGYLLRQDYKDGSRVRAGQLLFEIDPRQYKATLDQTLGTLSQAQAQLKQNQLTLARDTQLFQESVIAKQAFDDITQTTRASGAQVEADAAAVENAGLNLQWTKVYSPIDGVTGIAQAQVGDLVGTSTLLTTVSQVDPIKVSFPISEKEYLHFAGSINADENGKPTDQVRLELILDDGSAYSHPGHLYAANRQVDVETGTIMIQAIFANPGNILRPGMYAKLRAQTGIRHNALLVPESAVFSIQGQNEVAVVGADNRVALRAITLGNKVDTLWVIDDGLNPGEKVVTDGVQKIRVGTEVKPVLADQPKPSGVLATAANP